MDEFNFSNGDVVLAEWEDKLFYAKIQKIDRVSGKCSLIFDDDSIEECPFSKIHSVTETTAEIVCIICKDGTSRRPNEIVLCDKCGIGYHQECHNPAIPAEALEFDAPWMCVYCSIGAFCPYLENPFESKPARKGVRRTRIHTLKSGESCVSSGNSTEDEKDLPARESIKASEVVSRGMSSYYFSSHMHPREGAKVRGRPTFGHKSKSSGGDKRARGNSKPAARPGVRERDQHSDRNSEFDTNQQRKSSHHYQRQGNDLSARHSGRYGSPVRNVRLVEDSEGRKLSPAREQGSKRYQQTEENKAAKVISSHRRDAPREKQRLTQDLARQKRLLSEDIARAELLQREQLTKKFVDIFDNRKESVGTELAAVETDGEKASTENFHDQICNEGENDCNHGMYERCYGDHSPEYNNDHDSNDVCKISSERESLFDRFLRRGPVQEMKNIEFVNESKVEVKGLRYKNNLLENSSSDGRQCVADTITNSEVRNTPELQLENVSDDDELSFSDADTEEPPLENRKVSTNGLNSNGGSPTFAKNTSPVENGLDSTSDIKCNGLEEKCDSVDSPLKTDVINNLGYAPCECSSEGGTSNCDDKAIDDSFAYDNIECLPPDDPDHSSIKSSKIARLMEEPDMQCEHSTKNVHDCEENQTLKVSSCGVFNENDDENDIKNGDTDACIGRVRSSEINATKSNELSEKEWLENEPNSEELAQKAETFDQQIIHENAEVMEMESSVKQGKRTDQNGSFSTEQNSENVTNESELSNVEGMSDAGELSEPESLTPTARGKVKKKKRKKSKTNKNVHKLVFHNPRRKAKAGKARSAVKDASTSKSVKQIDSESDDDASQNKNRNACQITVQVEEDKGLVRETPNMDDDFMTSGGSPTHPTLDNETESASFKESCQVEENDNNKRCSDRRSLSPNEERFSEDASEEIVAMGTAGPDNSDSAHEANALSDSQRSSVETSGRKDTGRKEKRIGKTKRKSDEKDKDRERSTPPHLVSQNRYARDLPRHNWLVEQLLQQNKLCAEDTVRPANDAKKEQGNEENQIIRENELSPSGEKENQYAHDLPRHDWLVERPLQQKKLCAEDTVQPAKDAKKEQGNEDNQIVRENELSPSCEKENAVDIDIARTSPVQLSPEKPEKLENRSVFSPKQLSDHEDPTTSPKDDFQSELRQSFLRRKFPSNVPKMLPRLKPSSPESTGGNESGFKPTDNKPPPPPLKHTLPSKEASGLEPLPKLRKIVPDKEVFHEPDQDKEELTSGTPRNSESVATETEQQRKVISPIEILDDDDEKKKRGLEETREVNHSSNSSYEQSGAKLTDSSQMEGHKSPPKSLSSSPPDKVVPYSSLKKPFGAVTPTIPGSMKDKFGRPMHVPPHRAAILIPVVPMHDGNGMPISPGLGPSSPHLKSYSPRTFTPHLLTHSGAIPGPGMFGGPLSQAGRYPATNCGHHMHGNMKSGIPCKRDVNCPFHGNNPRGMHLDIPGHHGPMHAFGPHSHDHLSAVMSRDRRECDKSQCRQPECQAYQPDKKSPPGRDTLGDKATLQTPKVVKPIAHVPGKRPPLMLSHLQQIGKHSPATLRELEALHDDKARRFGSDHLLSPHQLQKSPERSPRERVVPHMTSLYERRPLHQPLTLSDLNRRREEEMLRIKIDEGVKAHPGELVSGLTSPSRGPAKFTTPPHSKDSTLISPGRGPSSASISPVDKRDQVISFRRLVDERKPGSITSEFIKPGPPRLRPLDEADIRLSSDRQRREELSRGFSSPLLRMHSAKDASPRDVEILEHAGRLERERNADSSHGNSSITNPGLRLLDEKMRQSSNKEERAREGLSPEMEHRLHLEQSGELKARGTNLELFQLKEKDPRMDVRDKESTRIPVSERERPEDLLLLRAGDSGKRSRVPFNISPPLRQKGYPDRPFPMSSSVQGRMDPRVDPRMAALHELELHRRGETVRGSETSHRELLSRMASSLPMSKGGSQNAKSVFVRPDGSLERRGPESIRLPSDIHMYSPPSSLASREYGLVMNSRQAMERLAAAAGKPAGLLAEVGKDVPPHIRQDIERERERERQRLSLEQIEANRRLLHAELKDKVNPLVFSKEHQLRMKQKRDHLDAMRAREKRITDRERLLFMERIAEEGKRRFSEIDCQGGIIMRHPSPPQFSHVSDREEYERIKRLKLMEHSISPSAQHSKHLSSSASVHNLERKDRPQITSPKNHIGNSSQVRDKLDEVGDVRGSRPLENEHLRKAANNAMFERDSLWHRNRDQVVIPGQAVIDRKRAEAHMNAPLQGLMTSKGGPLTSQREESKVTGKGDHDGVNRCSVCKREASFLCSGCQAAWYCSSECQENMRPGATPAGEMIAMAQALVPDFQQASP